MSKNLTVLFDLDGTLIDSTEAIVESFGVAFEHFNKSAPNSRSIVRLIGNPLSVMFANLGVEDSQNADFIARYKDHYRGICLQKTKLLPCAIDALKLLSAFAKVGVVTTKTASFSKEILAHLDAIKYISAIVGFEEVENPKPHPEPILLALKRLGATHENAYMIGDTPLDIRATIAAEITPIGVLCGYSTIDDLKPFNCLIKDDALEAAKYIKENFAA